MTMSKGGSSGGSSKVDTTPMSKIANEQIQLAQLLQTLGPGFTGIAQQGVDYGNQTAGFSDLAGTIANQQMGLSSSDQDYAAQMFALAKQIYGRGVDQQDKWQLPMMGQMGQALGLGNTYDPTTKSWSQVGTKTMQPFESNLYQSSRFTGQQQEDAGIKQIDNNPMLGQAQKAAMKQQLHATNMQSMQKSALDNTNALLTQYMTAANPMYQQGVQGAGTMAGIGTQLQGLAGTALSGANQAVGTQIGAMGQAGQLLSGVGIGGLQGTAGTLTGAAGIWGQAGDLYSQIAKLQAQAAQSKNASQAAGFGAIGNIAGTLFGSAGGIGGITKSIGGLFGGSGSDGDTGGDAGYMDFLSMGMD